MSLISYFLAEVLFIYDNSLIGFQRINKCDSFNGSSTIWKSSGGLMAVSDQPAVFMA